MKKNINIYCILSFVVPAIVIAIALASVGVYPGGEYTPFILDLRTEHLAFYNYLNNISDGFNSFSYQSLGGLGGGVINSLQMYCSPLCFIFSLFGIHDIPWVLWWIIVFMIGLCGLTEFIYLKTGFSKTTSDYKALLFSLCYSLMSCMVVYTIVPVWIWGGVFLPVIALGLDKLIDERKYPLFIISVALALIFDYYMAYILIIFSVFYFFYRTVLLRLSAKQLLILAGKCIVCGIVSCFLSAFSWLPVLYDLMLGKATEVRTITFGIIRNPIKVVLQLLPMTYDGLLKHSLPFIYCGIVPVVFLVLYFFDKKVIVRNRVVSFAALAVLLLCPVIGTLDIVWMFFAEPNGYPSRYSFVISFMMILLAAKGTDNIKISFKPVIKFISKCALFILIVIELCMNSVYMLRSLRDDVGPYSDYEEYSRIADTMDKLKTEYKIGEGLGRTVKNWRYTNDDGILYGYSDIDFFSSCYNSNVHTFLTDLGLNGQFHMVRSNGITPVVASVLGVDTFIQYTASLDEYYTYIGSTDGLDLYNNDMSLPIAFAVNAGLKDNVAPFTDDPFENINLFMQDIGDSADVFDVLPTELNDDIVTTVPEAGKNLWMYAVPEYEISQDIHSDDNGSMYYVYIGDMPICEYADSVSPFCVDLGTGGGETVSFSFDRGASIEKVFMASFDNEEAGNALNELREEGAYDIYATKKGMIFSIDLNDNKDIMITLPYINGYTVYVDGVKTEYYSYRNALMLIEAESGHHDILITYSAPGLMAGFIVSIITILIFIIAVFMLHKRAVTDR